MSWKTIPNCVEKCKFCGGEIQFEVVSRSKNDKVVKDVACPHCKWQENWLTTDKTTL